MYVAVAGGIKEGKITTEVLAMGNTRSEIARRAAEAIVSRVIPPHNKVLNGARATIRMHLARESPHGNFDALKVARWASENFGLFGEDTIIETHDLGRLITVTDSRKVVR